MRAAVERGEVQIGTWVTMVRNPSILMLLKAAGVDFARVAEGLGALGRQEVVRGSAREVTEAANAHVRRADLSLGATAGHS